MTQPETQSEPPGEPLPEPPPATLPPEPRAAPAAPPGRSRSALAVLSALGFLLLIAGLAWLWTQQQQLADRVAELAQVPPPPPPPPSVAPEQVAALEARLKALEQRVATLADRPAPEPAPAPVAPAPAPVAPAPAPVAAAPAIDLGPLEARVAALEDHHADTGEASAVAPLAAKLDSVAAEAAAAKADAAGMVGRLAELDARLKQAEQQQAALAARAGQLQRIEQAQVALDNGEPLGELPNAPAALGRFAHARPPTEAALRLAFPAAADAAEAASRPSVEGKTIGQRMWLRIRSLVTVRHGDAVLVGAPSATVLGQAQARLDAGDLGGALAALDGLDAPAAKAMAGWRAQAQALLDARAALAATARS
jgi:hypothetical protein